MVVDGGGISVSLIDVAGAVTKVAYNTLLPYEELTTVPLQLVVLNERL